VLKLVDGAIKRVDEPALTALNMRLRDDYTNDCAKGLLRWNKIITTHGIDFTVALPHVAFHRLIGEFKNVQATPQGELIDDAAWGKRQAEWLPTAEAGKYAGWIAPPRVGIDNKPGDFEYVKIET